MLVGKALEQVQFVVGSDGQPVAAMIDIATWKTLLSMLEEAEDQKVLQTYLKRRQQLQNPAELGLIPWEQVEAHLDTLEGS